ncbi:MAG: hypothetical protein ACJLS3_11065 [Erythrobacter sp.]
MSARRANLLRRKIEIFAQNCLKYGQLPRFAAQVCKFFHIEVDFRDLGAKFATHYAPFALAQAAILLQMRECLSGILSQTFKARPSAGLFFCPAQLCGAPGFFSPGTDQALRPAGCGAP